MIPSSLRIVYCKYHFWTYCFLPSTFPMWTWLFPPGVWREISGRSKKEESHSSSTFNSDCLFRPPLLLNLFLSCLETISLISFCLRGLWGLWRRLFSACADDLYLVLRCLKAELIEEEKNGRVGAVGVFSMLLTWVLEGVSGWAWCWLSGSTVSCRLSGLVFPSVFCASEK